MELICGYIILLYFVNIARKIAKERLCKILG